MGLPATPWDPHAFSSLMRGLLCLIFYVDAGDTNLRPHDCAVSTLPTECSNAPVSWLSIFEWVSF